MPQQQDRKFTTKDAWQCSIFIGIFAAVTGYFGRDMNVWGVIPVPLFVGAGAAFLIWAFFAAARNPT